jgi:hypothetical protein
MAIQSLGVRVGLTHLAGLFRLACDKSIPELFKVQNANIANNAKKADKGINAGIFDWEVFITGLIMLVLTG